VENRKQIQLYPFFRLSLSLIAGIAVGDFFWNQTFHACPALLGMTLRYVLPAVVLLLALLLIIAHLTTSKLFANWRFGVVNCLLLIAVGAWLDLFTWQRLSEPWSEGARCYEAVVTDYPQVKRRSMLCPVTVTCRYEGNRKIPMNRRVQLYMEPDSAVRHLTPGAMLRFGADLHAPVSFGNPGTFDYARYLMRHGVEGTGYVSAHVWRQIGVQTPASLPLLLRMRIAAMHLRGRLQRTLGGSGLTTENLAVLSAMALGDKSGLTHSLRDLYMTAGVSHVLALSGLHLSILYMVLNLILLGRWRRPRFQWISQAVIVLAIWMFVFLVGMPVSLVRSAVMYTLLSVSIILSRRSIALNTLSIAAFFILLFSPFSLFDVSFQLSFLSVLSIVVLSFPKVRPSDWNERMHRLQISTRRRDRLCHRFMTLRPVRYMSTLIWTSFTAQIGTAPLVAYYFNCFPTYFLLANIWVIPLTGLLVGGTLLFFVSGVWHAAQLLVGKLLSWLVTLLNGGLAVIATWPHASIGGIYPDWWDVAVLYLATLFAVTALLRRRTVYVAVAAVLLSALGIGNLYERRNPPLPPRMVIYNNSACPAVHVFVSRQQSYLITPRSGSTLADFSYVSEWWERSRFAAPHIITTDYDAHGVQVRNGILSFGGTLVVIAADGRWNAFTAPHPLAVDYIYLCHGYKGRSQTLFRLFRPRALVLDASVGRWRTADVLHLCDSLHIPVHQLKTQGALVVKQ
jgi:competence protein ComEC